VQVFFCRKRSNCENVRAIFRRASAILREEEKESTHPRSLSRRGNPRNLSDNSRKLRARVTPLVRASRTSFLARTLISCSLSLFLVSFRSHLPCSRSSQTSAERSYIEEPSSSTFTVARVASRPFGRRRTGTGNTIVVKALKSGEHWHFTLADTKSHFDGISIGIEITLQLYRKLRV